MYGAVHGYSSFASSSVSSRAVCLLPFARCVLATLPSAHCFSLKGTIQLEQHAPTWGAEHMPPLTLEQVLARSMRLPKQRAQRQVSRLYQRKGTDAASLSTAAATTVVNGTRNTNFFDKSTTLFCGKPDAMMTKGVAPENVAFSMGAAAAAHQEKLNFFELLEREDAQRRAGCLSIHHSGRLVRNSNDLTTYLRAAQHTGDWEGGLRVFAEATALPAFTAMIQPFTNRDTTVEPITGASASSSAKVGTSGSPSSLSSSSGIYPNMTQVNSLLEMCADAGQWALVEEIATFFAPALPSAFCRAVELLARQPSTDVPDVTGGWRGAFSYLTRRCTLPPAEIPVEAFNVCLRGCEEALDWRGALEVVRAMGPNPLQDWRSPEEDAAHRATETASRAAPPEANSSEATKTAAPVSTPPSPDVVSYATLIATLEQAGKDRLASEVLNRLPPLEKEEITASYAALIVVWSNQTFRRLRRRF